VNFILSLTTEKIGLSHLYHTSSVFSNYAALDLAIQVP